MTKMMIIFSLSLCGVLSSCAEEKLVQQPDETPDIQETPSETPEYQEISLESTGGSNVVWPSGKHEVDGPLKIGESWEVDGEWSLTILSVNKEDVSPDDDRYNYVYTIEYEYTNIGYHDSMGYGLQIYLDANVEDINGEKGMYYLSDEYNEYPSEIRVGDTCHAKLAFKVVNDGLNSITVSRYNSNNSIKECLYILQ